ncbi:9111_t:CDS:2 [Paraglomus occultum]|uniref:9111_t:CDS:1 n=1 Tax=Paraglomus occultum TaxID=144539 RepID=A0A9N9BJP1_9GLOM|nr:9111_t:CDS:2 [Paraglomus occultum]
MEYIAEITNEEKMKEAQTLKEVSDYIVKKDGPLLSESTIHRILEKIKYSYHGVHYRNPKQKQTLAEALDFMEEVNKLTPHLILSTDESGFPLNLAHKGGIIHWDLFKGAVNTEIFVNFINNVKLPTDEKYYLLIDKLRVHEAKKEVFHVIKKYVESQEPRTYEDLKKVISEKINELQEKGLTKYFKDCLDFDFILKSGH